MKKLTSIRISELTQKQLEELVKLSGMSQTEIIALALDRMFQLEKK